MSTEESVAAEWGTTLCSFANGGGGEASTLALPPMNSFVRRVVHGLAEELGLEHASNGEGKDKHILLTRKGAGSLEGAAAGAAAAGVAAVGSPFLLGADLAGDVEFKMCIEGQHSTHPDPEYQAFLVMDGAQPPGWDGACHVTAIRRVANGKSNSPLSFSTPEYDDDYVDEAEADATLLGKTPTDAVIEIVNASNMDLHKLANDPLISPTDGVEVVAQKTAGNEYPVATAALVALVDKVSVHPPFIDSTTSIWRCYYCSHCSSLRYRWY
jgi:hypothetical protein